MNISLGVACVHKTGGIDTESRRRLARVAWEGDGSSLVGETMFCCRMKQLWWNLQRGLIIYLKRKVV